MGRQAAGGRMMVVVDDEFCSQRRPAVVVKNGAAEEVDEPGPVCGLVVIAGYVEAEPGAASFHIGSEGRSLFFSVGEVVEPEDDLVIVERGIAVLPVGGSIKGKAFAGGKGGIEADGFAGKVDVSDSTVVEKKARARK